MLGGVAAPRFGDPCTPTVVDADPTPTVIAVAQWLAEEAAQCGCQVVHVPYGLDRAVPMEADTIAFVESIRGQEPDGRAGLAWSSPEIECSIPERFASVLARRADHPALAGVRRPLTYAQLHALADGYARACLQARPSAEAERVALLLDHDSELIAAALGVLRAGHAVVTLNAGDPPERLAQIRTVAEAELVITDAEHAASAHAAGFDPDQLVLEPLSGDPVESAVEPGMLAFLIATSGSTGAPKLVMQSHRNMLHNVLRYTNGLGVREDDRLAWLTSLGGGQGLATAWSALLNGATLCPFAIAQRGVTGLADWLEGEGVTIFDALPSILRSFTRTLPEGRRIQGVRLVRLASEPAQASDFEAYRRHFRQDSALASVLGSSETGIMAQAVLESSTELTGDRLPVGEVADGLDVQLMDESGRPVASGNVGEIVVQSMHLALGYWRDPGLTGQRFRTVDGKRCYYTGDLAMRTPDGSLTVVGRADSQVKIRGHRLQLEEVEAALIAQPGVAAAAVIARVDGSGDAHLAAFVCPGPGTELSPARLRGSLRTLLPSHAVPASFVSLEALPLSPNGKVDRERLTELGAPPATVQTGRPLESDAEERVANVWADALGREAIDPDATFFDLGGDSLTAAVIAAWMHEQFNVELALDVFDAKLTVARMAALVDRPGSPARATLAPLRRVKDRGSAPLSHAQLRMWQEAPTKGAGFNMTGGLRLRGELDLGALRRSLDQLLRRHEILRTAFIDHEGTPTAVVGRHAQLELPQLDLRSELDPVARRDDLLDSLAAAPFDLTRAPLMRVQLVRVGELEHWLLRSAHHIICDAPSWTIFRDELGALYEADLLHAGAPADDDPLQFTDYALWERENVRPGSIDWMAEVDWWKRRLSPPPPPLTLPFSRTPGSRQPSGARGVIEADLEQPHAAALDRIGRESGATLFMTCLAAFSALVALESGIDDIALDTYLSLRRFAGLQTMFGPLFNRAVLRLHFSDRLGFREWISQVRRDVVEVSRHGWLPFASVMDELAREGISKPRGGTRLAVLTDPPPLRVAGLELETIPRLPVSPWGFALGVKSEPDTVRWRAVFDAELHDGPGVERFVARLNALIAVACAEPERPLRELHGKLETGDRGNHSQEDRNVFFVVATLEVDDFEDWKDGFDRDSFGRSQVAKGYEILRSVAQPNMVFVRTAFDSVIDANAFRDRLRTREGVGAIVPATVFELTASGTYEDPLTRRGPDPERA